MARIQIVWLRRDLRLSDQPALYAAAQAGPVIPVYVLEDEAAGDHAYGGASRWWLHQALIKFGDALKAEGSRLILRKGNAAEQIAQIAQSVNAQTVHAIRHYEPWWQEAENELSGLVDLRLYDGNYLLPPGAVKTGSGTCYKIYSPFAKAMLEEMPPRDCVPAPDELKVPSSWPDSDDLDDWQLLPHAPEPDWAGGMRDFWDVGEAAAQDQLKDFGDRVADYYEARNHPSIDGSSKLSPYLHWGEISPVQVWHELKGRRGKGWETFGKEVIWRDFAQNIIAQFPEYPRETYRDTMKDSLWRYPDKDDDAAEDLRAWQKGLTGYPIVDAGMRQLWQTGWMHNRLRMICASFLVKHLLIDWRAGEQWYWDCLVDADYGNNGVNWQWIAGTGVVSSMFSRIMAPLSQSEKFDAAGYIREYVPELAEMSEEDIHDPADDKRGEYPPKIIGHKEGRERALQAYRDMKDS